ncbi:hypothetical protein ACLOJK_023026 [Asimina triloba]
MLLTIGSVAGHRILQEVEYLANVKMRNGGEKVSGETRERRSFQFLRGRVGSARRIRETGSRPQSIRIYGKNDGRYPCEAWRSAAMRTGRPEGRRVS